MQKEYGTLHHCERSEVILAECWRTKLKRDKKSMRKIGMRYEVASLSGMMDAEKECSIRVSFWMKRSVVKNLADEERL